MGVKLSDKFVKIEVGNIYDIPKYGKLKILSYGGFKDVGVVFLDTGYECIATTSHIHRGEVKDLMCRTLSGVGFLGGREYRKRDFEKAYSVWVDMIRRCYSENQQQWQPSYTKCDVADEWHNFQNFAKWYTEQTSTWGENLFLDKDLLQPNIHKKVYSPETCLLVTRDVNNFFVTSSKVSPFGLGVALDRRNKKYASFCGGKYIGRYKTPEEAALSYLKTKKQLAIALAEIQDNPSVAEAIINYSNIVYKEEKS